MQIININDKKYPEQLKKIKNPPDNLYIKGNVDLLKKDLIAIVGSRNYTEYGKQQTEKFSEGLTKSNVGIVSGMALGIDSIAHIETIKNGGKTIAVLGSGFNYIYPKENMELFNLIIKTGGAVVSEYPPDTKMNKGYFPKRNRIISGLSLGVLVIEATYRSGTSITANFAIEHKRKLYCLPNSIGNKNSCGVINLLKSGAKLATQIEDIIKDIGTIKNKIEISKNIQYIEEIKNKDSKINKEIDLGGYDDISKKIFYNIQQNNGLDSNQISKITKIPIQKVNSILVNLEIDGIIENYSGCKYKVKGE